MLNPFPALLVYSFCAPTLLRVVAALVFLYMAQHLLREGKGLYALRDIPLIGRLQPWMIWISVVISVLVAFCLFIGYGVQWAALVGIVITLKHLLATKKYQSVLPFARGTYILLLVICLSLLLSGAGAFGLDRPF